MSFEAVSGKIESKEEADKILDLVDNPADIDVVDVDPMHNPNKFRDRVKDRIVASIICKEITEKFEDDMFEADFSEEEVEEAKSVLQTFSLEKRRAVLSVPHEIRLRFLKKQKEKVDDGQDLFKIIDDIAERMQKNNGYTLGYHLSLADIPEPDDINGIRQPWVVKGTEADHRDNDLARAYYSLTWKDRYKEKPSNYLYVVRSETGEGSDHKQDGDNNWGRASSLSVVARLNCHVLEEHAQVIYEDKMQKYMDNQKNES